MIGAQGGRTPAGQGLGGYTAGFEEWPGPVQQPGCTSRHGAGRLWRRAWGEGHIRCSEY